MKLHEWRKSFETGNAVIDTQHRRLVESLNKVSTLSGEGQGKAAFIECLAFRKLTDEHFNKELEILRKAEFPRLKAHIREHDNFIGKFDEIFSGCGEVCKKATPCPVMEDLSFVNLDHIVRNDMDFKSHLQTRNLADNGA